MSAYDPLAADPLPGQVPPAATVPVAFESGGVDLFGVLHVPGGPGPHPVVVLLHGFPGNERNFDLAHAFSRAGFAALVCHYRGSWGVGGSWSWSNVLADAARLAEGVREDAFAAAHRLDPARVALVGHSLGGFAALHVAAADSGVRAVASVAGFDFGAVGLRIRADDAVRAAYVDGFGGDSLRPLAGTSSKALVDEMAANADAWGLTTLAPMLADRPVLLLAGERDTVAPPAAHFAPLVEAYGAQVKALEHRLFPTDHAFADHRVALARTLLAFLEHALGEGG
ncbi:alpha/beta hydrolase family protein [Yinghuangia seranimata]|uniref:alpha/beta hydrolase family protein n=1 Tax=Yinghuangia seranimata TaxID=408067 RepID=UPI00248AD533|nr:alpha/beta fold hydrolase [Yinghuangia seranimata]MDI2125755.1 alpha/beta fold hydrolase [Yinghuangia seranimata]